MKKEELNLNEQENVQGGNQGFVKFKKHNKGPKVIVQPLNPTKPKPGFHIITPISPKK